MSKEKQMENSQEYTCKNCSTGFEGNYCPNCGQTVKNFNKPFKFFIVDFMGNIFAFDTRLWKTFKAVLFKPGKMTRDFMEGKRVRYMPPFRFYIFISFIFFLMLNFQTKRQILKEGIGIEADTTENGGINFHVTGIGDEKDTNQLKLADVLEMNDTSQAVKEAEEFIQEQLNVNDSTYEEYEKALENVIANKQHYKDSIKNELKETIDNEEDISNIDFKHIFEHPEIYVERFLKFASWSLFLLMPLFSIFLLFFFRKTYKHYISHLIFSLNQHAFFFFLLILIFAVKLIFPEKETNIEHKLLLISPIYLFIGAKLLYKRGWIRTFFSLLLSVFLYAMVIIPVIILIMMLVLGVL